MTVEQMLAFGAEIAAMPILVLVLRTRSWTASTPYERHRLPALIAIFERESDAATFATAIRLASRLLISAVNVHVTGMVMRAPRGEADGAFPQTFRVEADI